MPKQKLLVRCEKPDYYHFSRDRGRAATKWWPAAFYNGGRHLYLTTGHPRFVPRYEFSFLPFSVFCRGGDVNGVEFRHLGHLFGVKGGPAKLEMSFSGVTILLDIPPGKIAWLKETAQLVKVYM